MNQLNNVPTLTPAFNKSFLKLESSNVNKEKYQYILDVLTNRLLVQSVSDALTGFPEYSGNVALWGVGGSAVYIAGDSVVFFNETNGEYTGIHKVIAVPNNDVVIIDAPWTGIGYFLQTGFLYKIHRSQLPKAPDSTATFNVNGFSAGIVGFRFDQDDAGLFNIPENFIEFEYLANEKFYEPITGTGIVAQGSLAKLTGPSRELTIGSVIQLIQDTGTTYNGIWEVIALDTGDLVISAPYFGDYVGAWSANKLPKDTINDLIFADIVAEKYAFNGALEFPNDLSFDGDLFDATLTQPCRFLTNIPDNTKMKIDSKGYVQFFQSNPLSCTQYVVDVIDENDVLHKYIVQLDGTSENMLGVSVGAGDLNAIPAGSMDTIAARGLPIIQDCDKSYDVYLWGVVGCQVGGIQTAKFTHPLGPQVLNQIYWDAQGWGDTQIQIPIFEIDGVPQAVFPSLTIHPPTDFTSQSPDALLYAAEMSIAVGGVLNINTPVAGIQNGLEFDIDYDKDFHLRMRFVIEPIGPLLPFSAPTKQIEVDYIWDKTLCKSSYLINGSPKRGFIGLEGNTGLESPFQLSEKLTFVMDWEGCVTRGARLIFQDRLGSAPGFNFDLKEFKTLATSADGYEKDAFDIAKSEIDRGFTTIQISYAKTVQINTDWLTQDEMDYLEEAMTNVNSFLQIDGVLMPCIILPTSRVLPNKRNRNLLRLTMDVRIYGTNYSQRN